MPVNAYFQARNELHDSALVHSQERQDLEASVTEINKELKLKWAYLFLFLILLALKMNVEPTL